MKVCLVSREFAPFNGWGAGTYAAQAARAMRDAGHDVHVLTSEARAVREGPGLLPGVAFHGVDLFNSPAALRAYASEAQRYAMGVYHALLPLHERHGFGYIEFPDFLGESYFCLRARQGSGAFAGAVLGLRLHMTLRQISELNADDWLDHDRATIEHMESWSLAHADCLIAPCRAMERRVRATLGDRCPAAATIPLPIDVDALRRELGHQAPSPPETPAILYCGRLERRKGVDVLARAFVILAERGVNARLRIVGEDTNTGPLRRSMRAHLERIIGAGLAGRAAFEPRADRRALGALFARSTIVCVPSRWENFPFACTEAMALGACVVGTDDGGMPEIIEDGASGLIARAGDAAGLADVLERALADGELRAAAARRAPDRVRSLCDPASIAAAVGVFVESCRPRVTLDASSPPTRIGVVPSGPAVSVVVPVYNTHEHLDDTLRSVRGQTFGDHETIVVDDGSTRPDTVAALEALAKAADGVRLRVVRIAHAGLSAARNAGVREARAEHVLPLDSDDMLAPGALAAFIDAARRHPEALFVTSPLASFTDDPARPVAGWVPMGGDVEFAGVANAFSSCVALMRRADVLAVGGYDTDLPAYEDWDLFCALKERFPKREGIVVPEFLVLHRLREASMMHTLARREHHLLRARILAKHPSFFGTAGRSLRFMLGDTIDLKTPAAAAMDAGAVREAVQRTLHENIRYRVADRLNDTLKRLGVQRAAKRVWRMLGR